MKTNYPTNLIDSQYEAILAIIGDNRKRNHSLREIFNALFYVLKTGCQWRMLPKDLPKWQLVYYYFCKWKNDGALEELNDVLRDNYRINTGRHRSSSVGLIDSQSVKATRRGGLERGVDGGKNIKGRKRHIVTDTNGLSLTVEVNAAHRHDSKTGFDVISPLKEKFIRMKKIYADGGYRGELINTVKHDLGYDIEITLRTDKSTYFKPLTKRWVVERTFSWLENFRRLPKDYEFCTSSSKAMIHLAFICLMINRIIN